MFTQTNTYNKIAEMNQRIRIVQGGTSAGKTIAILMYLIGLAQKKRETPILISVVSESMPHLSRGAIRDFQNIMKSHNYWDDNNWTKQPAVYTFETGSVIEFFSSDDSDKLRGSRRDWLFINEANNVTFDAFEQLEVRTRRGIFIDYNPTNEFWALTDVKGVRQDVDFIIVNYMDNESLSPEIVASIEQRKNRKGWWQVYGLGNLGEVDGKIYKDWKIIEEVPHEAKLTAFGLDFGFTNDPAALIAVYQYNGGYILDELLYEKGMHNKQVANIILGQENNATVVADCSEPKSIDEIKKMGVAIVPCKKGKDSLIHGVHYVQDLKISMTKNSYNLIREYNNYLFQCDKYGKILNTPEDKNNHAMDALRYALTHLSKGDSSPRVFHPNTPHYGNRQAMYGNGKNTNTSTLSLEQAQKEWIAGAYSKN